MIYKFFAVALLHSRDASPLLHFEAAMQIWLSISLSSTANIIFPKHHTQLNNGIRLEWKK